MIDVVCSNGDRAEAESVADAIYAARVLIEEAAAPLGAAAIRRITASFLIDGRMVLGQVGYGCVLALRELPGVCAVCVRVIEPAVRYRTETGEPVHMLCNPATLTGKERDHAAFARMDERLGIHRVDREES